MRLTTVICQRDLDMGVKNMKLMQEASLEPINFRFFEDGSLDDQDLARLRTELPEAEIITHEASMASTFDKLRGFRNCFRVWHESHREGELCGFRKKLFDVPLACEGTLCFMDTDILPLRRFVRLFPLEHWPISTRGLQQGYTNQPQIIRRLVGGRLLDGFNSGLFRFYTKDYDLGFLDWLLGRPEFHLDGRVLDQTCWAALFSRLPEVRSICRKHYFCNAASPVADEGKVLVHFIGYLRQAYAPYYRVALQRIRSAEAPVQIEYERAKYLQALTIHGTALWRRVNRWKWAAELRARLRF